MKLIVLTCFTAGMLGALAVAHAACPANATQECRVGGKRGVRTCDGLRWSECSTKESSTTTTTLTPKYVVITVVYSPPGNASNAPSTVSYTDGSSTGSTVGVSSSFQSGISVTAESLTGTIGGSFGFKRNATSSSSVDINKSSSYTIEHPGPKSSDGINNDLDAIYLALRPKINLTTPPLQFSLNMDGVVLQYVYVGWLKQPATMPKNVKATLASAGITDVDFPKILKASIYFEGGPASATNPRLTPVNDNIAIPYQPPFAAGEAPSRQILRVDARTTSTNTINISRSYDVGLTTGTNVPSVLKLKSSTTFSWTNSRSNSSSQSSTESATLTITGPSSGYTGPTAFRVYLDSLYKTFVFIPLETGSHIASGKVTRGGIPLKQQEVVAIVAGKRYKTWTDASGNYKVYAPKANSIEVLSGGKRQQFGAIPAGKNLGSLNLP